MTNHLDRTDSSTYRPWDREEKLGPVPEGGFKLDDPKVIAWEAAHGHDLRLKCYPEFGCVLLEDRADRIEAAAREALDAIEVVGLHTNQGRIGRSLRALKEALGD